MTLIYISLGLISLFVLLAIFCLADDYNYRMYGTKNYQVRFSPHNNKYYIVNASPMSGREKNVTGRFGFTIYYKDRIEADMISQKLNNVE